MKSHKNDGNKSSVVNFGLHGWVTIFYCLLMFWLYAGMVNSGANVTAPAIAEKFGILSGTVLTMNTVAGVVGVIFFIIVGQVNRAIGARITSGVCMILAGIAYWGVGNAVNLAMYTICMCVVVGGVMSAGYISGGDLVTQWFPKKKGIVMGYTTMGHNLASVAFVPLITYLVGTMGIGNGVLPISVCCIVLGVLGLLIVRNTPQERGLNPDNVSDEVYQNEYYHGPQDNTGGWTTKKMLCCKETWLVAITTGMFQICSLGVVSQMVLRNMELGFTREQANFTTSLVTSVYGRQGFSKVNSVIFPIQGAVSALSFVVNGVVSNITGGNLRYTYIIFAGVSIVSSLIVLVIDEHRFNRDWQQGQSSARS